MPDGKNDWVREVDFVRVLVDGGRDNRGVHNDRVIGRQGFTAQLHAGVLRWKVDPDVFVQDERYPNLSCEKKRGQVFSLPVATKKTLRGQNYVDSVPMPDWWRPQSESICVWLKVRELKVPYVMNLHVS